MLLLLWHPKKSGAAPPVVEDEVISGGNLRRRKPKRRVIRFSDFENKEQLAQAAIPLIQVSEQGRLPDDPDYDDDDALIHALLTITIH